MIERRNRPGDANHFDNMLQLREASRDAGRRDAGDWSAGELVTASTAGRGGVIRALMSG